MAIQEITWEDPYIVRAINDGYRNLHYLLPTDPAWLFEARRRYLSILDKNSVCSNAIEAMPYDNELPTWGWSKDMMEALSTIKMGDMSKCKLTIERLRGVHVLQTPLALTSLAGRDNRMIEDSKNRLYVDLITVSDAFVSFKAVKIPQSTLDEIQRISKEHSNIANPREAVLNTLRHRSGDIKTTLYENVPTLRLVLLRMQALLSYKALVVSVSHAPRAARRRTIRENRDQMDTPVKTITWRKVKRSRSLSGQEIEERDKHWWVTGHVRAQPYPSEGPDVFHPKYIAPHVKGNTQAPLYNPPVVNVVRR